MLWQALFKNLYSDLHIEGETAIGLESGSFSSGHVAEAFGKDSSKNSRAAEKQSGEEAVSFTNLVVSVGDGSGSAVVFMPHQGIAIDAFWDRKLSQDQISLAREEVLSWILKFQR